jgi:hypothetical protein
LRVYKFLCARFGLKSLAEKRLKISTLEDLNDPFELIPYDLSDQESRWALRATRAQMAKSAGMLCFSANWRNPVLWAHYSDKHQGLCIGFDVPEKGGMFTPVTYVAHRLPFPYPPTIEDSQAMLFTKYDSWKYEEEIRAFLSLNDEEDGLYFKEFDDSLKPVVVIAGARCKLSESEITQALTSLEKQAEVIKARAGFTKFEIVKDERGVQITLPVARSKQWLRYLCHTAQKTPNSWLF